MVQQLEASRITLLSRYLRLQLRLKDLVPLAMGFATLRARWEAAQALAPPFQRQRSPRSTGSVARLSSASQTERDSPQEPTGEVEPRPWTANSLSGEQAASKLDAILRGQEELKRSVAQSQAATLDGVARAVRKTHKASPPTPRRPLWGS